MKKLLAIGFLLVACTAEAQKGDELLVYSMKGNITVIENNRESKVKIGKVLKPGSTIKTERQAKLTMVCKQGKPLSLTKKAYTRLTGGKIPVPHHILPSLQNISNISGTSFMCAVRNIKTSTRTMTVPL